MISAVRVRGFKAIKDSQNVRLGSLTLLIGRNGSGKSSLVEAIQWLQEAISRGLQAATVDRFGSYDDLLNRRVSAKRIEIDVTSQEGSIEVRYHLSTSGNNPYRPVVRHETCFEGRTSGATQTIRSVKGKRGPAVRRVRGTIERDGDRLALGRVSGADRPTLRAMQRLRDAVFLRLSPIAMKGRVLLVGRPSGPVLTEDGSNLPVLLSQLTPKQRRAVSLEVSHIIAGVQGVGVHREGDVGYLVTKERMLSRGGKKVHEIPSWLLSEGTRRLTAIFALLAVEPRPKLLVVEEIENGLDPWTLKIVFRALHIAASEGVQVILTTHSPFLLDNVAVENVIHVRREDGDTTYTRISEYADVHAYEGVVPAGAMYVSDYFEPKGR